MLATPILSFSVSSNESFGASLARYGRFEPWSENLHMGLANGRAWPSAWDSDLRCISVGSLGNRNSEA